MTLFRANWIPKLFFLYQSLHHVISLHKHIVLAYMEPIIQPRFQGAFSALLRVKRNQEPMSRIMQLNYIPVTVKTLLQIK